jgi:microcystin-dependent protein
LLTVEGDELAATAIRVNGHYALRYDTAADSGNGAWMLLNPSQIAGVLAPYAGSSAPSGWLLCYGQAVSRTTYAALFTVLSTTYGAGDGSTTFNLPDLRGRSVFGKDDMGGSTAARLGSIITGTTLGATGGTERHTLTTAQLPSITPAGSIS